MTVIVTNCRNGEVTLRAPQCELDKLINGLKGVDGVTVVEQSSAKPTPIPQTVWNWGGQAAFARSVIQSTKKDADKPKPMAQLASTTRPYHDHITSVA